MATLCREFDISRKTGYKIFQRYKDCGVDGLNDRSRRPYRHANRLPFQVQKLIVQLKRERPSWGAPKIRERLARRYREIHAPAISTVCGRICVGKRKINLSQVFAGQNIGIKEVADRIWLVTFMHYDLGFFDHEACRLEPVENPFEPKVSPMSPV